MAVGRTALGRSFRAVSDDRDAAQLMGLDHRHVYAMATGIAFALVAVAGALHGMKTTFAPADGPALLLYGFEAVIIGGMGSFHGTLLGGIILGVTQVIGFRFDPGWGIWLGHIVFLGMLFRPDVPATGRHPVFEEWLAEHDVWTEPPTQAPQSMIYTSGTTGRPKGIIREPVDPEQSQATAGLVLGAFGLVAGMRTLVPAPMYHTAPNVHAISAAAGIDITIMPSFDPEDLLQRSRAHRIDHFQVVPTMFVRLLHLPDEVRARYDLRRCARSCTPPRRARPR